MRVLAKPEQRKAMSENGKDCVDSFEKNFEREIEYALDDAIEEYYSTLLEEQIEEDLNNLYEEY